MDIVLVHGIFDNGAMFRRLVPELEKAGHRCFVPQLKPADGREGIHDLACKLEAYIHEQLGDEASFVLIGFSMGCIVSRQYLQVLGGVERVKAFFAISGPHEGTLTAYLYIGQGARDLRPRSALLENLRNSEGCLKDLPIFVYWTSLDLTIFPAASCNWGIARVTLDARASLHRLMPGHSAVRADIVRRVGEIAAATPA